MNPNTERANVAVGNLLVALNAGMWRDARDIRATVERLLVTLGYAESDVYRLTRPDHEGAA